jgi:uncharacterized protein
MRTGQPGVVVVYCGSGRQISGRRESPPAKTFARIDRSPMPAKMPAKISPSRDLRVGRAKTGLGLFTGVPIKKGQFIIRYRGRKIPTEITDDLNNRYMFEINTRWTIDGANRRNIARYINHSCRPNSEVYIVGHDIKIRAIKNIKPGTELSYNYGRNYVDTYIKPAGGCKCHACEAKRSTKRSGPVKSRKTKSSSKKRKR